MEAPESKITLFWRWAFAWVLCFNVNQAGSPCTNQASNENKLGHYTCLGKPTWWPRASGTGDLPGLPASPPTLPFTSIHFGSQPGGLSALFTGAVLSALDPDLGSSRPGPWHGPGRVDTLPLALLLLAVSGTTSQYLHWTRPSLSGK